jgi:membrane protease YdiL (CAAX protease family)
MSTPTTVTGRNLASRHPLVHYFALTYAISWPFFLLSRQVGGGFAITLIVIGGFGPMVAAAWTVVRSGGSISEWLRPILRWRVGPQYYAYALGLPLLIMLALNLALSALGASTDWGALPARIPAYLQSFLLTAIVFGGQEEPGWRGFALPQLQQRHSPWAATLILGLGWGIWHVPLYGPAGFVVPLVLAFFYTWPYNKTGSVLLCILLHASFTPAQDHLLLSGDSMVVDITLLATYIAAALVLIIASRGQLGQTREGRNRGSGMTPKPELT